MRTQGGGVMRVTRFAMILAAGLALPTVCAVGAVRAAEIKPQALDSRVTSIALFKNGLAFVTREAALPGSAARLSVDGLPVPVHGTFWAWSPGRPDAVRGLVASLEPSASIGAAASLEEVLLANTDRDVEVLLADGKVFRGRAVPPPDRHDDDGVVPARILPGRGPLVFALSGGGTVVFEPASIQRISVAGGVPRTDVDRRTPKARL